MAWFENWFNTPYYHILYKDRDFQEAEKFISILLDDLKIKKKSYIIDLACGKGRHSMYFQKLGYKVLGLDLSKESIEHNLKNIKSTHKEMIDFKVHDMRDPILGEITTEKVDAVFNLFTSFGYFDCLEDDEKVFQSVSEVLKNDGLFVLDFLNETYVKKNLLKENYIEKAGISFKISKRIENNQVIKDIEFSDDGIEYHYFEKVKLHTDVEIEALATKFNFDKVKIYGDYELSPFDIENSPRCITIFRKK